MVVMDRQDYINKSNNLWAQPAYRPIPLDPTRKIKAKLVTILRKVKIQIELDSNRYKAMNPMGCSAPKVYGIPKIHKLDTSLGPILSSHGSVTYEVAKLLTEIPKPLIGKSLHHVHSTLDFHEQANKVTLMPGECLSSYNVTALFTSVPADPSLGIIKDLLEKDSTLKERTVLLVKDIIVLLEFCLKNTYFSFKVQYYEKVEGVAIGSSVSPIVANLYMEYFELKALSTATYPPKYCSGTGMALGLSKGKKTKLPSTHQ